MNIVSTWKKAAYRRNLTAGTPAPSPVSSIDQFELADADLEIVQGAGGGLLSGNDSHNFNVLSGNNILDGNGILNGAVSNIGVFGIGSNSYQGSGRCSDGCR